MPSGLSTIVVRGVTACALYSLWNRDSVRETVLLIRRGRKQ